MECTENKTENKVAECLLNLNQGADHEFRLRLSDPETKEPTVTAGCRFVFGARYRNDTALAIGCNCKIIEDGVISLIIPSDVTSHLKISNDQARYNRLRYDILKIDEEGKAQRILQGDIEVSPGSAYLQREKEEREKGE